MCLFNSEQIINTVGILGVFERIKTLNQSSIICIILYILDIIVQYQIII